MWPYLGRLKVVHYFLGWIGGVGLGWVGGWELSDLRYLSLSELANWNRACLVMPKKSMAISKFDVGKSKIGQILAM